MSAIFSGFLSVLWIYDIAHSLNHRPQSENHQEGHQSVSSTGQDANHGAEEVLGEADNAKMVFSCPFRDFLTENEGNRIVGSHALSGMHIAGGG